MGFLAPYMLWGALAAGIPIVLHFFFRSRYRTVPWAAMKFLLTSIEQTSRRLRFQELLLLLMRVALIVLLALALARPLSRVVGGGLGRGDSVDAVFLFDASYSMGANDGAKTRLNWAKDTALGVIDQLPPHSTVQIITCSDRAEDLGPRSPANLDQAREIIQTLQLTHLASDLAPGLLQAEAVVQRAQASNREFYLFSDMHQLGWEKQAGTVSKMLDKINEKASVYMVRCGRRPAKNAAIVAITPQSGVPRPGERVGFAVVVRNTSAQPVENIEVSLTVDGDPKNKEIRPIPNLNPGETRAVTLTGKLEKPGLRVLSAEIKNDDLAADNRFDQVLLVREQVNVLIVDGKPSSREPKDSASYFLTHALLPVQPTERTKYYLQPRVVTPRFAAPALLAKQDICILVNCSLKADPKFPGTPLAKDFIEELERFVRQGHALMIFAGDNVSPTHYNEILGKQHGLLPTKINGLFDMPQEKPLFFNRGSAGLPAFWKFRDEDFYKNFNDVAVWRALDMAEPPRADAKGEPGATGEARNKPKATPAADVPGAPKSTRDEEGQKTHVVFRYDNGKPAVLTRKIDGGEVMLVTTAASLNPVEGNPEQIWTIWPILLNVYVPFIDISVSHLLHGQTQTYNLIAGKTLQWYPRDKEVRAYKLINPEGKEERLGIPEKMQNREIVTATNLPLAGIYKMASSPLRASSEKTEPNKDAEPLAVVPDLLESDNLDSLMPEAIDKRLTFQPRHVTAGDDPSTFFGDERFNREWTMWLLVAVLALVLGESALAWWCGKSW